MDADQLFSAVDSALDLLAVQAKESGTATDDWISVSIPKLRASGSPLVNAALDAIEGNPAHKTMFNRFVKDATENPGFRASLKKSLRDPKTLVLVNSIIQSVKTPNIS